MKTGMKKVLSMALAVLMAAGLVIAVGTAPATATYATELTAIEKTKIEDDLKDIDLSSYRANPLGEAQLINEMGFVEYAYSEDRSIAGKYYGLYFYVYNPARLNFSKASNANFVNMAISFKSNGEAHEYENLALTYCDSTSDGLFYKFKLTDASKIYALERSYSAQHEGERRYHVAGIQLWTVGDLNPTDYEVAKKYTVTGYAKGCGADKEAEGTLKIRGSYTNTLNLPLYHYNAAGERIQNQTYYRTGMSSLGSNHQWQIDTVYFSIDNTVDEKYEKLQKIKATWYEYQTRPIFATTSDKLYNAFKDYIGVDVSDMTNGELGYGVGDFRSEVTFDEHHYYWNWGYGLRDYRPRVEWYADTWYNHVDVKLQQLDWLLKVQTTGVGWNTLTTQELTDYIKEYSAEHGVSGDEEYLAMKGYSEELFMNTTAIHADGKEAQRGKNTFTFDADETMDLRSYNSTVKGWDRFFAQLFRSEIGSEWQIDGLSPIEPLDGNLLDSIKDDLKLANKLYINERDTNEFRTWAKSEINAGKTVYLFRFAVTDYIQQELTVQWQENPTGRVSTTDYPVSMAMEAIFLGFEMIQVEYKNADGTLTTIGIVQSPIDIIDDIDIYIQDNGIGSWLTWCSLAALVIIGIGVGYFFVEKYAGGTLL